MWRITQTTPPGVEPLDRDNEVKPHIRVDHDTDDTLIDRLISAARAHLEDITSRAWIQQDWQMTLDAWPRQRFIRLPRPPLISVTSVTYTDTDGTSDTLTEGTDYIVDTSTTPGRIVLREGVSWPSVTLRESGGIVIVYRAGYGAAAADVPEPLRQALLLLIGAWYDQREDYAVTRTARTVTQVPFAVSALLANYTVRSEFP